MEISTIPQETTLSNIHKLTGDTKIIFYTDTINGDDDRFNVCIEEAFPDDDDDFEPSVTVSLSRPQVIYIHKFMASYLKATKNRADEQD